MPVIETKGAASSGGFGQFARQVAANYIEDVFSTYLYRGTGADQTITNGIDTTDGQGLVTIPYVTVGTAALFNGDDFVDRCAVPRTPINLNVSINTVTKKYGTGSFYFPGNGTSVLYTDSGAAGFPIGIGDFTVECWVYITNTVDGTYAIFSNRSSGSCFFGIDQISGGTCRLFQYPSGASATMSLNQWNHVAAVRSSGSTKVYLNGVGSSGVSDSNNYSSPYCQIGADTINGAWGITGYVDDFRLCIGQAVYTSNFTPPTGPLPATATTTATYTVYSGGSSLVWVKNRNDGSYWHNLFPMSFGGTKRHFSNNGQPFYTGTFLAPIPTGFTLKGDDPNYNANGGLYASWTFRKQAKFFDVVTYTGTGSNLTVNHNLGSAPGCIIIKDTSNAYNWIVYHRSLATGEYLVLNSDAAKVSTSGDNVIYDVTSTSFKVASYYGLSYSGDSYVAYIFAHDAGGFGLTGTDNVISCGSFTTDGSGFVPDVNLGYEPQWILLKQTNSANAWFMFDNMRGWSQTNSQYLYANSSIAEVSWNGAAAQYYGVITPTGFKGLVSSGINNGTFIYIAIRRGPMRTPTSATTVHTSSIYTGNGITTDYDVGMVADLSIIKRRQITGEYTLFFDRLRGDTKTLIGNSTAQEYSPVDFGAANFPAFSTSGKQTVYQYRGSDTAWNSSPRPYVNWFFKRAPGFFDVVCYTGNGTTLTANHNLGVVPEMMIIKRRDTSGNWSVYTATTGVNKVIELNEAYGAQTASYWGTGPTATTFQVQSNVNTGNKFVAYLFASCPGVSKVGSYTGTGTTQQINCGFTGGARFVLIKRTDDNSSGTANWFVWDTARGIVAGDDPYLLFNSNAAEVTNTDYIDTLSTGFEISSTAPAAINANGGSYIFLAIA